MTVEELNIVISAQNREFNEAINGVIGRLDNLEEQTRQHCEGVQEVFNKIAGGIKALGIGKLIGDSINSGGELEQNLGGVEVVFGQWADGMKQTAQTAAENMGLSQSGYLAYANKMGALFKGVGFDMRSASDMSQQAMQRAADVASIMGVDVSAAMEAVTGAAKGNFTMMDNLGVAINDTNLQIYAQEKGLGKLETTQQKVSAAMQMFLDKTEYAAGNYSRENDTFSGSLTTMKAEFENLTAELGTTLLPTATALISMARDGLELVQPLVVAIGQSVGAVGEYLTSLSPSAKTVLLTAVGAAVVIPKIRGAVSLLNTQLKASMAWLVILTSVLGVIASVGAARRELDEGAGEDMSQTSDGAENAAQSVDGLAESYDGLSDSADSSKRALADIDTLNVFSADSSGTKQFAEIVTGAESAQAALADVGTELDELDEQLNSTDLSGFGELFGNTFSDIKLGFATVLDAFNFDSDTQLSSLRLLNGKVKGLFGEEWTDFWGKVGSTIYKAFNGDDYEKDAAAKDVQDWLQGVIDKTTAWLGSINPGLEVFADWWNELWGSFGSWISDSQQRLAEYCKANNIDSVGDIFKAYFNGELPYMAKAMFIEDTGGSSGTFGGGGRNRLADYSFADYPEPESAAAGAAASTAAQGGLADVVPLPAGGNFTIYTTVELDGTAVGESVTEYIDREAARANGY